MGIRQAARDIMNHLDATSHERYHATKDNPSALVVATRIGFHATQLAARALHKYAPSTRPRNGSSLITGAREHSGAHTHEAEAAGSAEAYFDTRYQALSAQHLHGSVDLNAPGTPRFITPEVPMTSVTMAEDDLCDLSPVRRAEAFLVETYRDASEKLKTDSSPETNADAKARMTSAKQFLKALDFVTGGHRIAPMNDRPDYRHAFRRVEGPGRHYLAVPIAPSSDRARPSPLSQDAKHAILEWVVSGKRDYETDVNAVIDDPLALADMLSDDVRDIYTKAQSFIVREPVSQAGAVPMGTPTGMRSRLPSVSGGSTFAGSNEIGIATTPDPGSVDGSNVRAPRPLDPQQYQSPTHQAMKLHDEAYAQKGGPTPVESWADVSLPRRAVSTRSGSSAVSSFHESDAGSAQRGDRR